MTCCKPNMAAIVGAEEVPSFASYSVPRDALVLRPCITREMARERGFRPNWPYYDRLGCQVDNLWGWRTPEDCQARDPRALCPGSPNRQIQSRAFADFLRALGQAASFVSSLLPVLGPGLSEVVARGLRQIEAGAAALLGRAVHRLRAWLEGSVSLAFSGVSIDPNLRKVFHDLGTTVKSIADGLRVDAAEAGQLVAYPAVRASAKIALDVVQGHGPAVRLLRAHGVDAVLGIASHAGAQIARDARKSLVMMQETLRYIDSTRRLSPEVLETYWRAMPDLTGKASRAEIDQALKQAQGAGGEIVQGAEARIRGQADRLLEDLDGRILAAIVPASVRREFEAGFAEAQAYMAEMRGPIGASDAIMYRATDRAAAMVVGFSGGDMHAFGAEVRSVLERGELEADHLMREAAAAVQAKLQAERARGPRGRLAPLPSSPVVRPRGGLTFDRPMLTIGPQSQSGPERPRETGVE